MQTRTFTETDIDNRIIQNAYSMLAGNLYLFGREKDIRTIAITSCNPKEGKTSLANALAISMAGMGKKILLINMDLRKGNTDLCGIANLLKEDIQLSDVLSETNIPNMFFIDSGHIVDDPMTYLCSEKLEPFIREIRNDYDYAIFDTPPLEYITDALILSAYTDAVVLTAKMGHTTVANIKKAREQINKVNGNLIGVVLNNAGKRIYKKRLNSFNYY